MKYYIIGLIIVLIALLCHVIVVQPTIIVVSKMWAQALGVGGEQPQTCGNYQNQALFNHVRDDVQNATVRAIDQYYNYIDDHQDLQDNQHHQDQANKSKKSPFAVDSYSSIRLKVRQRRRLEAKMLRVVAAAQEQNKKTILYLEEQNRLLFGMVVGLKIVLLIFLLCYVVVFFKLREALKEMKESVQALVGALQMIQQVQQFRGLPRQG